LDELTSPHGSVALAIAALLLVLGFRLARPRRTREWVAIAAYAAALAAQLLGARGLLPGPRLVPGAGLRIGGAVLLVVGLLVAGTSSRARRRASMEARAEPEPARGFDPAYAGLALVLVAQLLRGPSLAGALVASVAVIVGAWVASTPERRAHAPRGRAA
jgi:protein-S-isoprenylcysteine O-methyltransferase Ste14